MAAKGPKVDREMNKAPQANVSARSLVVFCALLAGAIAPAAIAVAWIAAGQLSPGALVNAAVGGSVCWVGGALALTLTYLGNQLQAPVQGVLVAAGQRVPGTRKDLVAGLSEREIEVLRLIARGFSIKQIAQQLTVAPKTVDNHIQHIYAKIGVTTRAGATLFATEHQLL